MARAKGRTGQVGRGWHGDSDGHAKAAHARDKFNWWPLLLVPLAFLIGAFSTSFTDMSGSNQSQIIPGVGGGPPNTVCVTPTINR